MPAIKAEFPAKMRSNGEIYAGEALWVDTEDYQYAILVNGSHSHSEYKSGTKTHLIQKLGKNPDGTGFTWYEIGDILKF